MKFIGYGVTHLKHDSKEGIWPMTLEKAEELSERFNELSGAKNYAIVPLHAGAPFFSDSGAAPTPAERQAVTAVEAPVDDAEDLA